MWGMHSADGAGLYRETWPSLFQFGEGGPVGIFYSSLVGIIGEGAPFKGDSCLRFSLLTLFALKPERGALQVW